MFTCSSSWYSAVASKNRPQNGERYKYIDIYRGRYIYTFKVSAKIVLPFQTMKLGGKKKDAPTSFPDSDLPKAENSWMLKCSFFEGSEKEK